MKLALALLLALALPSLAGAGTSVCVIYAWTGVQVSPAMEVTVIQDTDHFVFCGNDDGSATWDEGPMLGDFILNPRDRARNNSLFVCNGLTFRGDKNFSDALFLSLTSTNP